MEYLLGKRLRTIVLHFVASIKFNVAEDRCPLLAGQAKRHELVAGFGG
jgi:hypothetical protein